MSTVWDELTVNMPAKMLDDLRWLGSRGYGMDAADVARYLIARELDDLRRARVLPFNASPIS